MQTSLVAERESSRSAVPLCVDLDGTLIHSDLAVEALVIFLARNPLRLPLVLYWWLQGAAHLKAKLGQRVELDMKALPLNRELIEWLHEQRAGGRHIVLCTGANGAFAKPFARELGIFDEVMASDDGTNLIAAVKAERLVAKFGSGGFDYAANHVDDRAVWREARNAVLIGDVNRLRKIAGARVIEREFARRTSISDWLRALRLHHWIKNVLLFVPLAAAHRLDERAALVNLAVAFVLFGFCASGMYLLNDLFDLSSDRLHAGKRRRPLAAGNISLLYAAGLVCLLTVGALLLAWWRLPGPYAAILVVYMATTFLYSLALKRVLLLDILVLAGLYTLRLVAGGSIAQVVLSSWLLAFSILIFFSLAAAKRYTELLLIAEHEGPAANGRGYTARHLPLLKFCGAISGCMSIVVLAFYADYGTPGLYRHPHLLWLLCPVLLVWIGRLWLKTLQGRMPDDPVVFAVTDSISWLLAAAAAAVAWLAT